METDSIIRSMFGANAVAVPFNCIVQPMRNQTILAVVAIQGAEAARLTFGSNLTHQLIMGDAVVRPHCVVESNHLQGCGLAGIALSGFADVDAWVRQGNVILDAMGRLPAAITRARPH